MLVSITQYDNVSKIDNIYWDYCQKYMPYICIFADFVILSGKTDV